MLLHLACQVIEKAAPAKAGHSEEVDAATDEESLIAYIFRARFLSRVCGIGMTNEAAHS